MNVEELLTSKDIKFTPKGADFLVRCLNPEHEDRNPSMRIDKVTGIFQCWSCGFKGNVLHLYGEKLNKLQMRRELLKKHIQQKRAENIGLRLPKNSVPYLGDWRNIRPETYKKFEAFQDHSPEYLGRIMFPVRNLAGRIVAFNGRHTTDGIPKYLISPAGAKLPLFPQVKPIQGSVILVEGLFDMLNLHDKGLPNAICCFGLNNVNEDRLAVLRMQGVTNIDILYDPDDAGQRGAEKLQTMCDHISMAHRNIRLKDSDPGALMPQQVEKLRRKLYK